jgi:hypothetical protein
MLGQLIVRWLSAIIRLLLLAGYSPVADVRSSGEAQAY